jgi:hypothetical protein
MVASRLEGKFPEILGKNASFPILYWIFRLLVTCFYEYGHSEICPVFVQCTYILLIKIDPLGPGGDLFQKLCTDVTYIQ